MNIDNGDRVYVRKGQRVVGGFIKGNTRYCIQAPAFHTNPQGEQEYVVTDRHHPDHNGEPSIVASCPTPDAAFELIEGYIARDAT